MREVELREEEFARHRLYKCLPCVRESKDATLREYCMEAVP